MTEYETTTQDETEIEQIHLPSPSLYPIILASGISTIGLGILTNVIFIIFGLMISIWALAGWAAELRHE